MGEDLVELEIGAFMGPHIKRARIVLAIVGALYVVWGWLDYSDIAQLHSVAERWAASGAHSAQLDAFQHAVNVAYAVIVALIIGGIANIVLAAIAGARTMLAFNVAAAIFIAQTGLQLYAFGILMLTNWEWWLAVIVLVMGYMAARKAEQLRANAKLAGSRH